MRALSLRNLLRTTWRRSVRLPLAVGLIGILALSAGLVAAAIPNSSTGVINGCFEKYTGLLRVIDVEAGKSCTRWETPISWSQTGPAGEAGGIGPQGEQGVQGAPGMNGSDGKDGSDGRDGDDGEDGNTIRNGPSAPDDSIGLIGDFYLDTSTSTLYGPKADVGWGQGFSLVGPQGPQGPQGPAGPGDASGGDPVGDPECTGTAPTFANATTACVGGQWLYQCSAMWVDLNASSADGCEVDTSTDPQHCGGGQLNLSGLASAPEMNVQSATCVSGQPQLVCDPGYEDVLVDGSLESWFGLGGTRLDGCESAQRADGLIVHNAGTGVTYAHSSARGTPGDASTYSAAMANEAARATRDFVLANSPDAHRFVWEIASWGDSPGGGTSCGGSVVYLEAVNSPIVVGVVWVYEGPRAGYVFHSDGSGGELTCETPAEFLTTWN